MPREKKVFKKLDEEQKEEKEIQVKNEILTSDEDQNKKTIQDEKLRLTSAQADKTEIEAKIKSGEYVEASIILNALKAVILNFRSKILVIPSVVANDFAMETDPNKIDDRLTKEIHKALYELSESRIDLVKETL